MARATSLDFARAELDAAGITGSGLRRAYGRCRELNARHGRTYFLATRLLRPAQRPAVHALYGFARWVDDLVDEPAPGATTADLAARLDEVERALKNAFDGLPPEEPVLVAVADAVRRLALDPALFSAFLRSMRMDLTVSGYATREDLYDYVHGSAEVIGLQMLPVLGTVTGRAEAAGPAAALGRAFQLTNFLRDVAEDLERGRVYLPADELAAAGVDRDRLQRCLRDLRADAAVRRALAEQVALTRAVYREAEPGVAMLQPASRPCVATAFDLYSRILDRIEAADHDVFAGRATVSRPRRAAVAGVALARVARVRVREALPGARR
ncbi:phytoene/squalene synthase family protein [Amycolatopsis magusensis]|uniref:phytoene/squalene synthase family protein n=1 Tax=Amycolatopsis magusensis TaxID=882444 RepID=UPI0024A81A62|nr:phytoene/squalene synthase family protein [Amycolatopsis magusensis]MDI5979441.1 phytoene/squalene synthase family protein [Amycolatopsis magusensis]